MTRQHIRGGRLTKASTADVKRLRNLFNDGTTRVALARQARVTPTQITRFFAQQGVRAETRMTIMAAVKRLESTLERGTMAKNDNKTDHNTTLSKEPDFGEIVEIVRKKKSGEDVSDAEYNAVVKSLGEIEESLTSIVADAASALGDLRVIWRVLKS